MDEIDNITEDELVAALFSAQTTGETVTGALTTRELTKEVGRTLAWVRTQLRRLIDEGKVESVRTRMIDIAGRQTTGPAYRLKDDKSGRTDILT